MKVRIWPAAEADIANAADYYAEKESVELGLKFIDSVNQTIESLRTHPHLGVHLEWLRGPLLGCRRLPVAAPFSAYQIFHRPHRNTLDVIRVLHAARDVPSILR